MFKNHLNRITALLIFILAVFPTFGINQKSLVKTYADATWETWIPEITALEKSKPADIETKLLLINLYYGYIGHLVDASRFDEMLIIIHKGEVLINEILKSEPSNVTAISYKGAFLGFRASINRFKYFGSAMEGLSLIFKSYDMNQNNLIAVINKASALYFLPGIFGGNKLEAARLLKRAQKIMEVSHNTTDNWMYYYVLIFIGRSYEKCAHPEEARISWEKVLQLQPEFKWVKNELYPSVSEPVKK